MRKSWADKTLKGICISIILSNISKSTAFLCQGHYKFYLLLNNRGLRFATERSRLLNCLLYGTNNKNKGNRPKLVLQARNRPVGIAAWVILGLRISVTLQATLITLCTVKYSAAWVIPGCRISAMSDVS